jgi:hypothetical protein
MGTVLKLFSGRIRQERVRTAVNAMEVEQHCVIKFVLDEGIQGAQIISRSGVTTGETLSRIRVQDLQLLFRITRWERQTTMKLY